MEDIHGDRFIESLNTRIVILVPQKCPKFHNSEVHSSGSHFQLTLYSFW